MSIHPLILGAGCCPVGEHWEKSLADLGVEAISAAMADAGVARVDAIVVGNMLSGTLNKQENLGALLADRAGLKGVEALKVEAACGSGGAALRVAAALVAGGSCERVAVVGVEKMTDAHPAATIQSLAYAADFENETLFGASFSALGALLTSLYLERHRATAADLSAFVQHAHYRAVANPWAMFRRKVTAEEWLGSPIVAAPLRLLDCPPVCDGAAALVLARDTTRGRPRHAPIEICAVEGAVDTVALASRADPLVLSAAAASAARAVARAGIALRDIQVFELHDAFPVMAALSLEAAGFLPPGQGWRYFASDGGAARPAVAIQTMGGLKGRGHPVGATGIYQVVEACAQLRGQAGANQVPGAETAMTQCFGGLAANVYTAILRRSES